MSSALGNHLSFDASAMKTRIVKIGNSRGIRLPKPLIEKAGLGEDVELRVVATGLLFRASGADTRGMGRSRCQDARSVTKTDCSMSRPLTDFDVSEWIWERVT